MRGRMSASAGYTKGVAIGEVTQGGSAGEVVADADPLDSDNCDSGHC
jgi:NADPH-dependent curcumin reductase CurA